MNTTPPIAGLVEIFGLKPPVFALDPPPCLRRDTVDASALDNMLRGRASG